MCISSWGRGVVYTEDLEFGSKLLTEAVQALCKLPGVGRRTAMRYLLNLQMLPVSEQQDFIRSLHTFTNEIQHCPLCNNFSDDGAPCAICTNKKRDPALLCVVADVRDMMAINQLDVFQGPFFILGTLITPLKGIGPTHLPIEQLEERIKQGVDEVILAFPNTQDANMTIYYLQKRLANLPIQLSVLAQGIPFGCSVDQTDENTIALAFTKRIHIPTVSATR